MANSNDDSKKIGNTVTVVGAGLVAAAAVFSAPALAVWGGWALLNGIITGGSKK